MSLPSRSDPAGKLDQPPLVPCPVDLRLDDRQLCLLEVCCAVPQWAIEECLLTFLLKWCGSEEVKLLVTWRFMATGHIRFMWSNPDRRPQKPATSVAPADLPGLRRARLRELLAEQRREREAWRDRPCACEDLASVLARLRRPARATRTAATAGTAEGAPPGTGTSLTISEDASGRQP